MAGLVINETEEINSFAEFDWNRIIHSNRLKIVFFDIDDTLVKKGLSLRYFYHEENQKDLMNILSTTCPNFEMYDFIEYIRETPIFSERVLTEENIVNILQRLQQNNVLSFALTARSKKYAESTEKMLKKLGIDFSTLSEYGTLEVALGHGVILKNGIIYTDNRFLKVAVIPRILTSLGLRDATIKAYFFDNSKSEINAFFKIQFSRNDSDIDLEIRPILYLHPSVQIPELIQTAAQEAANLYEMYSDEQNEMSKE